MPDDHYQQLEYAFGDFRLSSSILEFNGRLLPLSPKAIDTLYFLVSRAPEIVTREELMAAVWPDTFVVESGLARNVSLIRKALEENGGPGPFIETIPKRGYRFVAPLESRPKRKPAPDVLEASPVALPPPTPNPRPEPAAALAVPDAERSLESARSGRGMRIRLTVAAAMIVLAGLAWWTARQYRAAKVQPPFDASTRIGRHLLLKASPEEVRRALDWFEAAVTAQPGSAQAHAGLAETLIALTRLAEGSEQTIRRARTEAEVAVRLDPNAAEAHIALGAIRMNQLEFPGAEKSLQTALRLDPTNVMARYYYAQLLNALRRPDEARQMLLPAIAHDPVAPFLRVLLGRVYYSQRQFETAARTFEEVLALERDDSLAHYYLGLTLGFLGRFREAEQHLEQSRLNAAVLQTDRAWLALLEGKRQLAEEVYSRTLAGVAAGRYGPSAIVLLAVALGKSDEALAAIEKEANRDRTALLDIQGDPRLEAIRNHPRFQALVARTFGQRANP